MSVNWGLAGQGFNPLQVLQSAGMAQQQKLQEQQAQVAAQQQQRQQMIGQQAASGDVQGAQTNALAGGDFDLAGQLQGMNAAQQKQLAAEGEAIGRLAYGLRQIQNPQERAAAFQASIPAMRQQGFSDDEIRAASQDLSDGVLDGYVRFASDIQQQFARSRPDYQVIPEGGTLVDTRNPQALQQFGQQQSAAQQQTGPDLQAMAAQAIANGADPAAVQARMQQLQGGGQTGAPSGNFPVRQ